MLISNRISNNKLYRGVRYEDQNPLTSGDVHESLDLMQVKHSYLTSHILGSGMLNSPMISYNSSEGVSIIEPAVILLDGDIILIQSDNRLLPMSMIQESQISDGVLCIVGWYQHMSSTSTIRSYGGVDNQALNNDIRTQNGFDFDISTRYQFRWDRVIIPREVYYSEEQSISFNILNRDKYGELLSGSSTVNTSKKVDNIRVATAPAIMKDYVSSDLYIIPIISYLKDGTDIRSSVVAPLYLRGTLRASEEEELDNTLPLNADTLGGHNASYFASKSEVNTAIASYVSSVLGTSY